MYFSTAFYTASVLGTMFMSRAAVVASPAAVNTTSFGLHALAGINALFDRSHSVEKYVLEGRRPADFPY